MKYLIAVVTILISIMAFEADAEFAPSAKDVRPLLEGMSIPNTVLKTTKNEPASLRAIVMQKPTVLIFYRGGWCPYCNKQLAEIKTIETDLENLGYQIVAISPQSYEELKAQELKTNLAVQLFIDPQLETIEQFGIGFTVDAETVKKYDGYGISLTKNNQGESILPAPAIFIIDEMGIIQFSYVNPDYTVRPSAALIHAAAKALTMK